MKEAVDLLDGWLRKYPNLLRRVKFGKSFEGRDLFAYVLRDTSANPPPTALPQAMVSALVHARWGFLRPLGISSSAGNFSGRWEFLKGR